MATVALIGADGAGKTTVGRRVEEQRALPIKYIYMGVNPETSNHMLPTTRLILQVKRWLGKESHVGGPPDPSRSKVAPRGLLRRSLRGIKGLLRTTNLLAEEWYRQLLAWWYQRRGFVVLFDRHFFWDYHAHDISTDSERRPSLARRIHGHFLRRLYPKPDLVVLLDAPAEVLFERKREGTVELIELRRQEYFRLREQAPRFEVVDATQPLDVVVQKVLEAIRTMQQSSDPDPSHDTARRRKSQPN